MKSQKKTHKWAVEGGNTEFIAVLTQNGHSFDVCLATSVKYHRDELITCLLGKETTKPFSLPKCIEYYNIDAFLYFLEHDHSIDETDEDD